MNLYLLTRTDEDSETWDEACGFVVRAVGPVAARKLAGEDAGDEGKFFWLRVNDTRCELLAEDVRGDEGVVLRDFHHA